MRKGYNLFLRFRFYKKKKKEGRRRYGLDGSTHELTSL
jgi:hypothetical protein